MYLKPVTSILVSTGLLLGLTTSAYAEVRALPSAGKWSVTPEVGTSFNVSGDFVDGASNNYSPAPLVGSIPGFLGFTVQAAFDATINSQDFDDVYDPDIGAGISFNFGLSDVSEVFGRFRYNSYDAESFTIATIDTAGTITGSGGAAIAFAAGTTVTADMDDYEDFNLTAGYRRFFMGGSGFYPYASIELGVAFVSEIEMTLSTAGAGNIGTTGFYEDSTIFTGGLGLGFRYEVGEALALGAETTLKYIDGLDEDGNIIGGETTDDERFDIGVNVGLTWAF